ncbi:MAG: hypothetical protein MI785_25585 [Kiloniellales bacterium]|nr:hypothetical protein [Kiloniellales bacterium]
MQAPGLTAIGEAALYGDLEAVEPQLEKGGGKLRAMMPWLSESKLVDKTKN